MIASKYLEIDWNVTVKINHFMASVILNSVNMLTFFHKIPGLYHGMYYRTLSISDCLVNIFDMVVESPHNDSTKLDINSSGRDNSLCHYRIRLESNP